MSYLQQYSIPAITQTVVHTISKISVQVNSVILNQSANLTGFFYDSSGNLINVQCYTMSGSDYALWSGDDNFVVNWVAKQIGSSYP